MSHQSLGMSRQVFFVSVGNYDTHSGQLGEQLVRMDARLIQTLEQQHDAQLAAFRDFAGQLSELGSRQRINLALPEGDGVHMRDGGHGGSGWRGNDSRARSRRQNESLPKRHFSILSIPREFLGLSIIGHYGKTGIDNFKKFCQGFP